MARQRMGQHFLADASWQQRILDTLPRTPDETWIEIGAGHGEMAAMGRVKTPSKEGYAAASKEGYATALDWRIGHWFMVML